MSYFNSSSCSTCIMSFIHSCIHFPYPLLPEPRVMVVCWGPIPVGTPKGRAHPGQICRFIAEPHTKTLFIISVMKHKDFGEAGNVGRQVNCELHLWAWLHHTPVLPVTASLQAPLRSTRRRHAPSFPSLLNETLRHLISST